MSIGNQENKVNELTKFYNLSLATSSDNVLQLREIKKIEFPILTLARHLLTESNAVRLGSFCTQF